MINVENPTIKRHKVDKVYEKYSDLIMLSPENAHIAIIDDGCPEEDKVKSSGVLLKRNIDIEKSLRYSETPGRVNSGHGWNCTKLASSIAPSRNEISMLSGDLSYWNILSGIKLSMSLPDTPDIVSISQETPTNAYQNMYVNELHKKDMVWVTHYSRAYQYPAFFLNPRVLNSRYLNTFGNEEFGANIAVAITLGDNDNSLGMHDKSIPSLAIESSAPSWATALLAGMIGLVTASFNISPVEAYKTIYRTATEAAGAVKIPDLEAAFDELKEKHFPA